MLEMNKKTTNDTAEEVVSKKESVNEDILSTYPLATPMEYNGVMYDELHFDFEKLTGRDGAEIEYELNSIGKAVLLPVLSIDYLIRMAARACREPVGVDFFEQLPLNDFNKIRNGARRFLLRSES